MILPSLDYSKFRITRCREDRQMWTNPQIWSELASGSQNDFVLVTFQIGIFFLFQHGLVILTPL